ncbi:MAG: hypothetical protein N2C14_28820, partial [Planctomycetales bacterium]
MARKLSKRELTIGLAVLGTLTMVFVGATIYKLTSVSTPSAPTKTEAPSEPGSDAQAMLDAEIQRAEAGLEPLDPPRKHAAQDPAAKGGEFKTAHWQDDGANKEIITPTSAVEEASNYDSPANSNPPIERNPYDPRYPATYNDSDPTRNDPMPPGANARFNDPAAFNETTDSRNAFPPNDPPATDSRNAFPPNDPPAANRDDGFSNSLPANDPRGGFPSNSPPSNQFAEPVDEPTQPTAFDRSPSTPRPAQDDPRLAEGSNNPPAWNDPRSKGTPDLPPWNDPRSEGTPAEPPSNDGYKSRPQVSFSDPRQDDSPPRIQLGGTGPTPAESQP